MYDCMFTGCHLFCIHFQEFEIESTEGRQFVVCCSAFGGKKLKMVCVGPANRKPDYKVRI